MNPIRVVLRRTMSRFFNCGTTAVALSLFMASCASYFAYNLSVAEGGLFSLPVIWAMSVSPFLPLLIAFFGMDLWRPGRGINTLDVILSSPVRERDFVFGKFLALWLIALLFGFVFHLATFGALAVFAPRLLSDLQLFGFVPAFFALALQSAAWSAVVLFFSALARSAAGAAALSVLFLSVLPRACWAALLSWAPQGHTMFGEMPLDAHVNDISNGMVSFSVVASYVFAAAASLFCTSKLIASSRFRGRGAWGLRLSTFFVMILACATFVSSSLLAWRMDFTLEFSPAIVGRADFSARIKNALSETGGEMIVTAFLSRKDPQFRPVAHFLRSLQNTSEAQGGAKIFLRYVDPDWDLGAAASLVRSGAKPGSVVFQRAHRIEHVPLSEGLNERTCISTLHRLASPPQRRCIYWTVGHGENSFLSYDAFGMSTIARDITHEGYKNRNLDLTAGAQIPSDCALVMVAGAKNEFSRLEIGRLDAYLRQGGRLLVMLASAESVGVSPVLSRWGIRPMPAVYPHARTLSGTDVIATDFANHPITSPLQGSQIVFEKPVSFSPSAAVATGTGADQIEFTPLAAVNNPGVCIAAAAERGVGAGEDLRIRPTRIVVAGDAGFVMNGALNLRANANRDFFLNCIAYLAGNDSLTESGDEKGRLVSGLDRTSRIKFLLWFAIVYPGAFFVLSYLFIFMRKRSA